MSDKRATQQLPEFLPLSFKIRTWYADYKRFLFLLIPFFLLALFVIFKFSLSSTQTQQDFISAKNAYLKWEKGQEGHNTYFHTLRGLLKKHPELVVPYETLMIQKLIALGKAEDARPLVENTLKRALLSSSTYYTQFAKTTILIEGGTIEEMHKALKEAIMLKEEMLSDEQFWQEQNTPHFGSILFAFNLLRIGFLSETLGKREDELFAWRELRRYAKWSDISAEKGITNLDGQAFNLVAKHFTEGNLSLQDYIKYRETIILSMQKKGSNT